MNCPRHLELSAYLDDALETGERQRFAAHLQGCAICSRRLEALTGMRQAFGRLPSPVLGFDLAGRIESQIRAGNRRRRPPAHPSWLRWWPVGAVAAASFAAGTWLGGLAIGTGVAVAPPASMARVFDPIPPGGLCAAAELCRSSKGMQ